MNDYCPRCKDNKPVYKESRPESTTWFCCDCGHRTDVIYHEDESLDDLLTEHGDMEGALENLMERNDG